MRRLDRWLIERAFEPASALALRWGVEPSTVTRFLLITYLAGNITQAINDGSRWRWTYSAIAIPVVALRMWYLARIERMIRRGANPEKHGLAEIALRMVLLWLACASAILCMLLAKVAPSDVGFFAALLHFYFSACDRPPPQEQREPANVAPEAA